MQLGYHSITWGGVTGDAVGVTSVKDLYYRANGSLLEAVGDIAAAGYSGVEVFDGNLVEFADRPELLRRRLADSGLQLASVYTGANFIYPDALADEVWRIERAADLAALFGAQRLAVGGGARRADGTRDEDYTMLGAALDRVVKIAEQRGLVAAYHPHLTTIVESPAQLDTIMARSQIALCPDTAHLAAGGGDPGEIIRKFPERIAHVHLKDYRRDPFAFLPLGQGELDFRDVLAALREIRYDGWVIVELDSYDGAPVEAAQLSRTYLNELLSTIEPRGRAACVR
ncbi:MAG: sugar phosphate isomerase/epimerase family protein [Streptosporangiaceae bacterium]